MNGSMSISELTLVVEGATINGVDGLSFSSVSTDSRRLQKGDLFIALQGPNFDGNQYIDVAAEKGAVAALVSCSQSSALAQIVVKDTLESLGLLAATWRRDFSGCLVGITGSNGKTTVKEMVTAIFSKCGETLATKGNLNNDIGVPLTLLRLQPEHRYAVIEMGANHQGEIAYTAGLAKPDIAIITNAAAAHLEGFGDIQCVAKTKGEIVSALPEDGVAILNRDDAFYDEWEALAGSLKVVSFGFSAEATVRAKAESIALTMVEGAFNTNFTLYWNDASVEVSLKLAGNHNVKNALAAAAACLSAGCSLTQVKEGLELLTPVKGRLCSLAGLNGAMIIDDSYNANPASCSAALDLLSALDNEKWMALGSFAELGEKTAELHREIGREIKSKGVKRLFAVGKEAQHAVEGFGGEGYWFEDQSVLIKALKEKLFEDVVVLVKGSRSQKMEQVVEALTAPCSLKKEEEAEDAAFAS